MEKLIISLSLILFCSLSSMAQTPSSPKSNSDVNPILPFNLCADPTAVEYNGRLYIYGTNDQQELETTGDRTKNTYGKITQLVCMSSADLVNWTFHGPIDVKSESPWIATSWAPSIVSRVEEDGLTHFYLYYTNTASGIGVLTSTSPTGPWRDPLGRALINGSTPGRGEQSNIIDPGVCIDDNGVGWLTFGGGDPNQSGSTLMPGNARIVKLGKNMISLDGEMKPIPAPFHFEANELNYINGKYVFSYSGGWSCNAGDWNNYNGRGSYSCPGNCSILYMITDDPINGTWIYKGEMLKNPGTFGYPWGNNHSHLQKYAGNYYMTYHTQYLEAPLGLSGGYRSIAINKASVNESTFYISSSMNNAGPSILTDRSPVANEVNEAESMANGAGFGFGKGRWDYYLTDFTEGAWTLVRNVRFPEDANSFTCRVKGKGTIKVYSGRMGGNPLCEASFDTSSAKELHFDLRGPIEAGKTVSNLYFVFSDIDKSARFDYYQFNKLSAEEMTAIKNISTDDSASSKTRKRLSGSKVVIERGGHQYSPTGQLLK